MLNSERKVEKIYFLALIIFAIAFFAFAPLDYNLVIPILKNSSSFFLPVAIVMIAIYGFSFIVEKTVTIIIRIIAAGVIGYMPIYVRKVPLNAGAVVMVIIFECVLLIFIFEVVLKRLIREKH